MNVRWPFVRLDEVLAPIERVERVDASKEYRLLGVRLDGQGPFLRETLFGSQSSAAKLYRVATGDFIYSRLFACRGAFGIIEPELDCCYVSSEFPTFVPKADRLDARFLNYWFRLPSTIARVDKDCTGSTPLTRNRFKQQYFLALQIQLPQLAEQQRLLKRIEELASKIAKARALRRKAVEEGQALLVNHVEETFSQLEQHHQRRSFGSFSPHVTSGPRDWGKHYEEGGFRFYRAQDIGPNAEILNDRKVFVAPPPGKQGRSAMVQQDDLLLVITGATVGRVSLYRDGLEPGFVSQHVGICRLPNVDVEPKFALWGLRSTQGQAQLLGQCYGQGKPGLNLANIRLLSLPFPSLPEQRRIVEKLDAFEAEVTSLRRMQEETAVELDGLLPSILDRAFDGELLPADVPELRLSVQTSGIEEDFRRSAITCYIVDSLHASPTFGRTQLVKALYLAEAHTHIELHGDYERQTAGPFDKSIYAFEDIARKNRWFRVQEAVTRKGHSKIRYIPLPSLQSKASEAVAILGHARQEFDRLLALFRQHDTKEMEIIATLYAAWNDLLLWGHEPVDDAIVHEILGNWHEAKRDIPEERWRMAIDWMRKECFVPTGFGKPTQRINPSLD